MAAAALLHLLDLLLLQLDLLRCLLSNPHEGPARQLTLQLTPSNLVLPLNRARVLGSSDKWPPQLLVSQWAQVSATPLEECLEGLAPQLSNNHRRTLWLARPMRAAPRAIHGVREAVRRMRRPLPSVWTTTRATCRSVAGIWIN